MKHSDFIHRLMGRHFRNPFIGRLLFLTIAVCLFSGCGDRQRSLLSAVLDGRTEDGTAAFSGRVVGVEGEAVSGLSLAIEHVMFDHYEGEVAPIQPLETQTDTDGAFSFRGIPAGQVQLILPFEMDTEKQYYIDPEDEIVSIKIGAVTYPPYPFDAFIFTITPGVHIRNVEVKVRPRMRIRGRIVFNDGSPLADAEIRIGVRSRDLDGSGGGSSSGGTQTDADGTFTEYVSGEAVYTVTVAYQDLSATSEPFVLNAGERREDLVLMFESPPIPPAAEDVETSTPPVIDPLRPRGVWVVNPENGHAYKEVYVDGPAEAKALATAENAYLVSINDAMEQQWLERLFGPDPFWIGLSDVQTEGEWQWESGEPVTYTNWSLHPIFPDDLDAAEKDYVVKTFTGEWQAVGTQSPFWRITRRAILETDHVPVEAH